jgi:broad specificity polyphosphatase/5'/3'-nucleotidase SurE
MRRYDNVAPVDARLNKQFHALSEFHDIIVVAPRGITSGDAERFTVGSGSAANKLHTVSVAINETRQKTYFFME